MRYLHSLHKNTQGPDKGNGTKFLGFPVGGAVTATQHATEPSSGDQPHQLPVYTSAILKTCESELYASDKCEYFTVFARHLSE